MEPESGLNENFSNTDNNTHKRKTINKSSYPTDVKSTISLTSNIDLSNVEANEESLKPYTLTKQFLKLDLDKIRELIEILEDYYISLVEKEDLKLAKAAKQKLILLKKLEKEKMMIEAKIIYSNQIELVEDKMKAELNTYILNSDTEYENLLQRFKEQEDEIEKINKEELDECKINLEQSYSQLKPKPSKECLNWMRIKKYALKQNKFNKAQEAEQEIEKLNKLNNIKFNENKLKKLNLELDKIKKRQINEKNVYEMKKNLIITEFNENKQKEIDKIKKKYFSKISELKNYQNFEISNFDKITKGVIKPCSRIQSIVSSATGIKDDGEEEKKNENVNKGEEENNENKEINNKDVINKDNEEKQNEEENDENKENNQEDKENDNNEEEKDEIDDNGEEYINKED